MCASCGCQKPEDQHGDQRNIKLSDIEAAAKAAGTDSATVVENMRQMVGQAGSQVRKAG